MESLDQMDATNMPTQDERNIALLSHIGTLIGGFIVPLVIWLVKKDESDYVSSHAKESLNFQLSMMIYLIGGIFISFVLAFFLVGFFLMFFVIFGITILAFVTTIIATINASQGKTYHYPMTIRFFS